MSLDRRELLVRAGLAAGAAALSGCVGKAAARKTEPPSEWSAVRKEFLLAPDWIHLTGFFLASHPRQVREAIERHRRALDENPVHYLHDNIARFETEVRAAAAEYLECPPDELAMTDSTTMGLGCVYGGLLLQPGDEIVTTLHDHIVTHVAVEAVARKTGATVRKLALYDAPEAASAEVIVERMLGGLRAATRVLAVTWVHSGTGVKLPIPAMAAALARVNAERAPRERVLLVVDGVHGFGLEDVAASKLGCDVFVAGCHKWLFGPRGTGVIWARPEAWARLSPTIPSMDPMWREGPLEKIPPAAFMTPGGFHSFEHRWALTEAFRFHQRLGRTRVATRIHELAHRMKNELSQVKKVRLKTPRSEDLAGGILCFEVEGQSPDAVVARLREKKIVASVTPEFYTPPYARLAPSLLVDEEEVSRAVKAVAAL
jgi:selenocysteine lyase/cysteine desulfurase